jgi:hypothetical protein
LPVGFCSTSDFHCKLITASKQGAYDAASGELVKGYPKFHALAYSLDVFVPVVDLHQAAYWLPDANEGTELKRGPFAVRCGSILRYYFGFT